MSLVSVILVNYNTAVLAVEAVRSLQRDQGSNPDMEILLVDNASDREDRGVLEEVHGIRRIFLSENRGFAAANNHGLEYARGRYVFFLNPDTVVFPRAVERLTSALDAHPSAAAVGPRTWWDTDRTFQLPPTYPLTPALETAFTTAGRVPGGYRAFSRWWTLRAARYWRSTAPTYVPALSGAALLTRRSILDRIGPLDARNFFMYFEDADWCLRARKAGMRLLFEPGAETAHFVNQSGRRNPGAAAQWMEHSKQVFFRKHFGAAFLKFRRVLGTATERFGRPFRSFPFEILPEVTPETRFRVSGRRETARCVFQVAVDPLMVPSAGRFTREPEAAVTADILNRLGTGWYFATLTRLRDLAVVGAWKWQVPGRPVPSGTGSGEADSSG